jgi:hypothetical protein
MGGKALKNLNCIRINKEKYEMIKKETLSKLEKYLRIESLIELPEKETYGDLDLIYDNINEKINEIVKKEFNPAEMVVNGPYLSYSYYLGDNEYFQIDLINVNNIKMAKFYLSYGDLGCIIGQILKKNNLRFGHDGLYINYMDEKIILLNEPEKICNYLKLDYEKYIEGFKTKNEIFSWIIDWKYFNTEYFNLKELNSNRLNAYYTRPFFREFCDIISKLESPNNYKSNLSIYDYINLFEKNKEKEEIDKKLEIRKLYQEKYSGLIFMKYLENKKDINKYKEKFKDYISLNNDFTEWLKNKHINEIELNIKEFISLN